MKYYAALSISFVSLTALAQQQVNMTTLLQQLNMPTLTQQVQQAQQNSLGSNQVPASIAYLDTNHNGVIDFSEEDTNHDGFISRQEYAVVQDAYDAASRQNAQNQFNKLDTNGDHKISFQEFSGNIQTSSLYTSAIANQVRAAFNKLDTDGDGFLTLAEFTAPLEQSIAQARANQNEAFNNAQYPGYLSQSELAASQNQLASKLTNQANQKFFNSK